MISATFAINVSVYFLENRRQTHAGGGEGGIRTLGRFDPTPDFESGTFDHSATSPNRKAIIALRTFLYIFSLRLA